MKSIIEKARYGLPFSDELIIDSHCHFGSHFANVIPYSTPEEIITNMDRIGIDKACFMTSSAGIYGDEMLHARQLADFVNKYPDRLYGYVALPMNYREAILEHYLKCEAMGLNIGVKMHTYCQKYDVTESFIHPIYERLNKKHGLIIHHDFGPPGPLEDLLKAYPNIAFIAGHMDFNTNRYISLLKKYDNFYNCTCATLRYDEVREFTAKIGSEKIIHGSDLVVLDSTLGFGPILYANITNQEKLNILGLNMEKLLKKIKYNKN